MLGAQARYAEYTAAKNASARQASREAEEQKLPPKPAPLSLGSFTKSTALNRNKGAKKYTPLILDSTEEEKMITSDDELDSTTPLIPLGATFHLPIDSENPSSGDRIRVKMPIAIPTAPRAMRAPLDPFSTNIPDSAGNSAPTSSTTHRHTSFYPFNGPLAHPNLARVKGLPYYDFLGRPIDMTPDRMQAYNMMVPNDLTPTKQEDKLTSISEDYTLAQDNILGTTIPVVGQPVVTNPTHMQCPYFTLPSLHMSGYDLGAPQIYHQQSTLTRPALPHFHSDITPLLRSSDAPTPAKILARCQSSIEDDSRHVTPSRLVANQTIPETSSSKPNETYDHTSKMQKFAAVQQAYAKTGKTVLHNPDLHRNNKEEAIWDGMKNENDTPVLDRLLPPQTATPQRLAPKIPPGLDKTSPGFRVDSVSSDSDLVEGEPKQQVTISAQDIVLCNFFGVGSDAWFDCTPPGPSDRLKMQRRLKEVADKITENNKRPLNLNRRKLNQDPWGPRPGTIEQHASEKMVEDESERASQSGYSDGKLGDGHASVRHIAGQVDGTAEQEKDDDKPNYKRDYFGFYGVIPEYAIRHEEGLGANLASCSRSEAGKSDAVKIPTRIARGARSE